MLGQHGHFALYVAEKIPYAIERYRDEAARLYRARHATGKDRRLCRRRLFDRRHRLLPRTMTHKAQGFTLDDYPNIKRWYAMRARPCAGRPGNRQIREGAVRRGGAAQHVSATRQKALAKENESSPSR